MPFNTALEIAFFEARIKGKTMIRLHSRHMSDVTAGVGVGVLPHEELLPLRQRGQAQGQVKPRYDSGDVSLLEITILLKEEGEGVWSSLT